MFVQTTPQSVLLLRVAPQSPASRAGLSNVDRPPGGANRPPAPVVVRLLSVNGRPVADLTTEELVGAFTPGAARDAVTLMIGRRGASDVEEGQIGPIVVQLVPSRAARVLNLVGQSQWQRALELAGPDADLRGAVVARMLFAAQRQALEGKPEVAVKILALVPLDDPDHDRALELTRHYERVSKEARRR
jgi:hypothetical protein